MGSYLFEDILSVFVEKYKIAKYAPENKKYNRTESRKCHYVEYSKDKNGIGKERNANYFTENITFVGKFVE